MSKLSPGFSRRLEALKALLVVGVVAVHSGKALMAYTDGAYSLPSRLWFVLAGHNVLIMVVPVFFAISGFLHFRSYRPSLENYLTLVRKKTRSLLVPYILANVAAVIVVALNRKIPFVSDINELQTRGWLSLALGIDNFPILYPLWFLRDLYALFLATPIFLLLANRLGFALLLVPVTLLSVYTDQSFYLSLRGIIFFGMGLFFARHEELLSKPGNIRAFAVAFVLLTLAESARLFLDPRAAPLGPLNLAATFCALPLVWHWARRFDDHPEALPVRFGGLAFFVYLFHEPMLSYLIYYSRFILKPVGPVLEPLGLVVVTCLTVVLLAALASLLQRTLPGLYALLTGGRAPGGKRPVPAERLERAS